jgi:predicted nuclease of predicted toxin-antitoxin system
MKFLVDAQLPRHLAATLNWHGQDALHTLDLPEGNRTTDWRINPISLEEQRVVITKDADFVNSFLLSGVPYKLLLVQPGILATAIFRTFSLETSRLFWLHLRNRIMLKSLKRV